MSSGMLLLAGLFATGPASAAPVEEAPMPRAKSGRVAVEFRVDLTPRGVTFGAGVGPARPQPEPIRIAVPALGDAPRCPVENVGPPPEVRVMMLQALEQMAGPVVAPQCPHPVPMPAPAPTIHAMPVRMQAAWSPAARTMPLGAWTREVGPVSYRIEIKGDTMVVTTSLTEEDDDGKLFTVDHVMTADWYPTRNEHEIVGLVKGFDIATRGKSMKRDDVSGLLGSLADIQKQLNGKPIAMTLRPTDGGMMIGDVRLPVLKDDYSELSSAFAAMGGNYKAPTSTAIRPSALAPVEYRVPVTPVRPMPLPQPLPRSNPFRNGGN